MKTKHYKAVRDAYKLIRGRDELIDFFPGNSMSAKIPFGKVLHWVRRGVDGTDIHHICGGANGASRVDHPANFVLVCRTVHDWLEKYRVDGVWLCLRAKQQRGELDLAKLNEILGVADCLAYFSLRPVEWEWVQEIKQAVLEDAK